MSNKYWYFVDEKGNVACFTDYVGDSFDPIKFPDEEHLKKVCVIDTPFTRVEEHLAMTEEIMGPRRYWSIPADHKIAKYVREHGVEVEE